MTNTVPLFNSEALIKLFLSMPMVKIFPVDFDPAEICVEECFLLQSFLLKTNYYFIHYHFIYVLIYVRLTVAVKI